MVAVGFEPTKHNALDLESSPFDRAREHYLVTMKRDTFPPCMTAAGFDPAKRIAHDLKSGPFDLTREHCLVCFSTLEASTPSGTRTHNPQIRSLMRYPIAPMRQFPYRDLNPGRLGENQVS